MTFVSAGRFAPARLEVSPRRTVIVCPPFQYLFISSLATARLAAYLRRAGFECGESYLHFELARLLGEKKYLAAVTAELGAELLFAEGLHGSVEPKFEAQLTKLFGEKEDRVVLLQKFEAICLEKLRGAELLGITTSNNQLLAALWIAQKAKRAMPGLRIVLGGAACGEPMGSVIAGAYDFVDWVVNGYGEAPLLALAQGHSPRERVLEANERTPISSLPAADFAGFLREAGEFDDPKRLWLSYEASRGCWWGMKHQCTFCGLNGVQMKYEEKPTPLVLDELRSMWSRYRRSVLATDLVLSLKHLKEVVPALAETRDGPPLFFEVKANLTQQQVATLWRAQVSGFQPGIESLSTKHLKLIRKGTDRIHNVAVLKWCREQRITLMWNLLCGIPGEDAADYEEQMRLFEKIPQLQPPTRANPVRIDRYSPYFDEWREFGWQRIEPAPEYKSLHPQLLPQQLNEVAYHFDGFGGVSIEAYFEKLEQSVARWQKRFAQGVGLFQEQRNQLMRRRDDDAVDRIHLDETHAALVEKSHDLIGVQRLLAESGATQQQLQKLVDLGVFLVEESLCINLAVRIARPDALRSGA